MSQDPTQQKRLIGLGTPLGPDTLLFRRMTAREELGRPFEFLVDVYSQEDDLDLAKLLGQNITVRLALPQPEEDEGDSDQPKSREDILRKEREAQEEQYERKRREGGGGNYNVWKPGDEDDDRYWEERRREDRERRETAQREYRPIETSEAGSGKDPTKMRYFNGYVTEFRQLEGTGRYTSYRLTVRPWLWFLSRTADCRIFQEKTAPDIIKEVFSEKGFTDFEDRLTASYRQREYCVQYRETDMNFVCRLMEEDGIYFFFQHENGKHILILADSIDAHETVPDYETVPYYPPDETNRRERDHIHGWVVSQGVQTGQFALTDYDFKAPKKNLRVQKSLERDHDQASFEIFDYPGRYKEPGEGETYAQVRIEELQAQYEIINTEGNAEGLAVGTLFDLENHPRKDQNRAYILVSTDATLSSDLYESGGGGGEVLYETAMQLLPAAQPYRTPWSTPKPVVRGPQTAVVVGPSGEEIYTDEYGRVKVQFHWDRYGHYNEESSCWVRVSHPWAGQNWGAVSIPRIGQEVIVDFLEGDPDQPIITGRVYNANQMPPYPLPDGKVMSGVKSNSTKGGGGYNEIVMDDTKGQEQLRLHAQYNMDTTVLNNQTTTVHNSREDLIVANDNETVGMNQTVIIGANKATAVTANWQLTVGGTFLLVIASNATIMVEGSRKSTVMGKKKSPVGAGGDGAGGGGGASAAGEGGGGDAVNVTAPTVEDELKVEGSQEVKIDKSQTVTVGKSRDTTVGAKDELKVKGLRKETIEGGRETTVEKNEQLTVNGPQTIDAEGPISITSKQKITLSAGGSTIELSKEGVTISTGKLVTVTGSNIKLNS